MSDSIKVCPFCSGKTNDLKNIIHAETCYFSLLGMRGISQAELDAAWNTRTESYGLQDQIEKLDDFLFVKEIQLSSCKTSLFIWKTSCFLLAVLYVFARMLAHYNK